MKRYIIFILIIILVAVLISLRSSKDRVLVCKKTLYEVGGEVTEEIVLKESKDKVNDGYKNRVLITMDDEFTESYFNYINDNKECYDLKRDDNILEYKCKFYIETISKADKTTLEDAKKILEKDSYECSFKEEK